MDICKYLLEGENLSVGSSRFPFYHSIERCKGNTAGKLQKGQIQEIEGKK
jgi:hypothetical protein